MDDSLLEDEQRKMTLIDLEAQKGKLLKEEQKKNEEKNRKKMLEEKKRKQEAARKAEYEAYLASKREEEAEELTQSAETNRRVKEMRASVGKDPTKFHSSIVDVLEDYQGKRKDK